MSSLAPKLALGPGRMDRDELMQAAFPVVNPGIRPFGSRVLVQIRRAPSKTRSGIILADESRDTEKWNTQIAKVVMLGPVAFRNRSTLDGWPEGNWCGVNDYVRVPKYGGDRWEVPVVGEDPALFVIFNDLDLIGKVEGDPLAIQAYV